NQADERRNHDRVRRLSVEKSLDIRAGWNRAIDGVQRASEHTPRPRRAKQSVFCQRNESARRPYFSPLPQCRRAFVLRLKVAKVIKRQPDLRREKPGLLFARRYLSARDVRVRRR